MSQNFAADKDLRPAETGQVIAPQQYGNTGPANPVNRPVGSIYQPTAFFPRDNRAGFISLAAPPPASNFGSQYFPAPVWNTIARLGNALNIFKPNVGP